MVKKKTPKKATKKVTKKQNKMGGFNPHKFEKDLSKTKEKKENKTRQNKSSMIVYVGMAKRARRIGIYTRKEYVFEKDSELKPIPIRVDNLDLPALIQEKGKGCWRVEPMAIFILKEEWDKNCN